MKPDRRADSPRRVEYCRACTSSDLVQLHDFGDQPLAGHYPLEPENVRPARRYPLDFMRCSRCKLMQIVNLPPIDEVFHADYRYSSSTVAGLVRHFDEYAVWLREHLAPGSRVLEFGCNDGVLLERLKRLGFDCIGVDASDNIASLARAKGLAVETGFFEPELVSRSNLAGRFGLVTCSNVFAHIHNLRETLSAVRQVLVSDGLFCIEVHDGDLLVREYQFDAIYHEHLSYFTADSLRRLLESNGFETVTVERTAMHGGGLRYLARRKDSLASRAFSDAPAQSNAQKNFLTQSIQRCSQELRRLNDEFGPLTGYGAAGRSQMFINFTSSKELFQCVYDDSPLRQGRFIAGTDIPIKPYSGESGRCAVVLAWNYAPDIAQKIKGRFDRIVTLLPKTRTWS
jgi:SAM-dependent methyltransferase